MNTKTQKILHQLNLVGKYFYHFFGARKKSKKSKKWNVARVRDIL